MEFKNVTMLKEYHSEQIEKYKPTYDELENARIHYEFGTKILTVTVKDIPRANNSLVMKLTATLKETIDEVLFVHLDYQNGGRQYTDRYVEEKFANMSKDLFGLVLKNWLDYMKFKKLKGIVFGCSANPSRTKYFQSYFEENKVTNYTYYKHLFNVDKGLFSEMWGVIDLQKAEQLLCLKEVQDELDSFREKDPTFVLEPRMKIPELGSRFRLELHQYRYQNELFWLTAGRGSILFQGYDLGDKEYPLLGASILEILDMVKEGKRMENLFHPSVKNAEKLFHQLFKVFPSTESLELFVQASDAEIGVGETEKELHYVMERYYVFRDNNPHESYKNKKLADTVVCFESSHFNAYRIQTDKYYWFLIANPSLGKGYSYASKNKELPEEQREIMSEWTRAALSL